ncbi:hypothetical protein J421_1860 [Gemmatirosa kalamazoonensis]|uniref:Sodium/hydrogen exchanger n=1 Tax=Gemmatirosa kalamazoonensis TaxID=861299 RepID=W0RG34_9BACT|nr:hypothetical protein [Gemmatirosa kalamazoonensis]AHG89397.1 hypothetical protein J421_1860 [Gemmatirosa kalamazoonensis]
MSAGVLLVVVVVVAYLATHVAYDWVARRFLVVSGAEYLVLGLLLGPQASGVIPADVVKGFAPLAALAVGWMGVLVGMQFHLPTLVRVPGLTFRLAFAEALATLAAVSGATFVLVRPLFALTSAQAVVPAVALGAIACASTPAGLELAARMLDERASARDLGRGGARLLRQLRHSVAIDALVAIVAIGLIACVAHPAVAGLSRQPTTTEWAAITLGIGVGGGVLFHLFLGGEREPDRLFVALAGAVILASGAATFLRLSPLLACIIVGAILVNTSSSRVAIASALRAGERPLYYVLLIFAGMSWKASTQAAWFAPVLAFLVVRTAMKVGAPAAATWWNDALPTLGGRWGRALLGQGGLAIALAFDYLLRRDVPLPNVVFTTAAVSVLLTEFAAVRLVRAAIGPVAEPAR